MSQQYRFILFLIISLSLLQCKQNHEIPEKTRQYFQLSGQVIGTYYSLKYKGIEDHTSSLDSIFNTLNLSLSTYVKESIISKFNSEKSSFKYNPTSDIHFIKVWDRAKEIYKISDGDFDPTVGPLVNYWGFGYKDKNHRENSSNEEIQKLLKSVGYGKVTLTKKQNEYQISKETSSIELDFSAIAKGYYVDEIARYLESKGIKHYLVDIGGESTAKGINQLNQIWTVGINKPKEDSKYNELELAIQLNNLSIASSGNYRNYYVNASGKKYVHTIDPKTGLTKTSTLLSATIIAKDCMSADALATTCMVKGLPSALKFIETIDGVEACFIYSDTEGVLEKIFTTGFEQYVLSM